MRGETSDIRFSEAQKLLDYGFNNFEYIDFSKKDDILKQIIVDKGIFSTVDAVFEEDSGCLIKKGESKNIVTNIYVPDKISAPVKKRQKLGEIVYSIDGNTIASTNIVSKNDIKKLGFWNMCTRIIGNWFSLLR